MSLATDFVSEHARAILVTRRRDGGLQASPIRVLIDASGDIVAVTRAPTAKARNLARDDRFTLCVISDGWSGAWMTIEGRVAIERLPDALPALRAFYLQRDGSVLPEAEFADKMASEERVVFRFSPERTSAPPA